MMASEWFTSRQEASGQAATRTITFDSKQLPEYTWTKKKKLKSCWWVFLGGLFGCFFYVPIQQSLSSKELQCIFTGVSLNHRKAF